MIFLEFNHPNVEFEPLRSKDTKVYVRKNYEWAAQKWTAHQFLSFAYNFENREQEKAEAIKWLQSNNATNIKEVNL